MDILNTIHYIWRFKVFIMSIYSLVNTLKSYWNVFHLFGYTWDKSKLFYCDLCALKCMHACVCVCVCVWERERELGTDARFTVVQNHLTCLTCISQPCVLLLLAPRDLAFPSFAFFSFLFPSSSLILAFLLPLFLALTLTVPSLYLLLLLPSSLFSFFISFNYSLFQQLFIDCFLCTRKYVYYIMNKEEKMSFRQDSREISYK